MQLIYKKNKIDLEAILFAYLSFAGRQIINSNIKNIII